MTIIRVRHGETALNVGRTLQPADTPLSERGLAQAEAVARRLATMGVAGLLSSDLPRAWSTAQAIAAATGLAAEASMLLQERNFGALRGKPYDTLGFDPLSMAAAPPDGESRATFEARVAQAFAEAVRRRAALGGTLVVVSHGLVIHQMAAAHLALGTHALPLAMANTSLTVFGALPPHLAELIDDVAHLDALSAHRAGSLSGG